MWKLFWTNLLMNLVEKRRERLVYIYVSGLLGFGNQINGPEGRPMAFEIVFMAIIPDERVGWISFRVPKMVDFCKKMVGFSGKLKAFFVR